MSFHCYIYAIGLIYLSQIHRIYIQNSFLAAFSMLSAFFTCFIYQNAAAGIPETGLNSPTTLAVNDYNIGKSVHSKNSTSDVNIAEAMTAISGSPYPGIINHLLQKPLPNEEKRDSIINIHINYPSTGNKTIDADIRSWVNDISSAFESHFDLITSGIDFDQNDNIDLKIDKFLNDDDLNSENLNLPGQSAFELWGDYTVTRPSDAAVSITFELWNHTRSAGGNLDIITLNYSLLTGQRLNLVDIFENTQLAINLMSEWSKKILQERLGTTTNAFASGTEPLIENFSSLTLTPEGICINFQPYQVAPGDAGIQKVQMPISELIAAAPLLELWGK